jgi:hypothetical protein
MEVKLNAFVTLALDGGEWTASHPGRFTLRKSVLLTHRIGGWVGPRAYLDSVEKIQISCAYRSPRNLVTIRTELACLQIEMVKWKNGDDANNRNQVLDIVEILRSEQYLNSNSDYSRNLPPFHVRLKYLLVQSHSIIHTIQWHYMNVLIFHVVSQSF